MRLLATGALVLLLTETGAGAVDFAEYLLPGNACSQRSLANDFGNQRKFTISELIAAEERESDIWYAHQLEVTASGPRVSIWFRASPDPDSGGFRVFVDEVKLEEVQP